MSEPSVFERYRPLVDNVFLQLEPLDTEIQSKWIITSAHRKADPKQVRFARVLASGPGYWMQREVPQRGTLGEHTEPLPYFVPNVTKAGDRVLVAHDAGNHWGWNTIKPRHNKQTTFEPLDKGEREVRIVREDEILLIIDED